jgi:hypothetical protein
MRKFKKGDWIVASKMVEVEKAYYDENGYYFKVTEQDGSYTTEPVQVLHKSGDHYVVDMKGCLGTKFNSIILQAEIDQREFVRASRAMVALMRDDDKEDD